MKKALIAAVAAGALLASQAAADTNSATVGLSDRLGSTAGASDDMAGMGGNTWIYFLIAAAAIGGGIYAVSNSGGNGAPASP